MARTSVKHSAIASCASLLFLPNFDVICDLLLNRRTALEAVCEILVCVSLTEKIQDWILKSEGIQKRILRFFTRQINPRSLGLWCVKGTEESTLEVDFSVPLTHHDPRDLGLICLVKKCKIHFPILSDLKIQSWIFLKKHTLSFFSKAYQVEDKSAKTTPHLWPEFKCPKSIPYLLCQNGCKTLPFGAALTEYIAHIREYPSAPLPRSSSMAHYSLPLNFLRFLLV